MKPLRSASLILLCQTTNVMVDEIYQPTWDHKNMMNPYDAWLFDDVNIIDTQGLIEQYSQLPLQSCTDLYTSKKTKEAAKCDAREGGILMSILLENLQNEARYIQPKQMALFRLLQDRTIHLQQCK